MVLLCGKLAWGHIVHLLEALRKIGPVVESNLVDHFRSMDICSFEEITSFFKTDIPNELISGKTCDGLDLLVLLLF